MLKWLLPILFFVAITDAQVKRSLITAPTKKNLEIQSTKSDLQSKKVLEIIKKIEQGIQQGVIVTTANDFGSMISVSFGLNERGYVSSNQAISMLTNYFSNRRSISFQFSHIQDKGSAPFATGRFVYLYKGIQESAQVYIAFTNQDSKWVINQLNIY
jgi:hypothetical protein